MGLAVRASSVATSSSNGAAPGHGAETRASDSAGRRRSAIRFDTWTGIASCTCSPSEAAIDTAAVTAQLEKMKDEPTLFGPRTFTSEIHHQNRGRYLIVDTEAGKPGVVDEWTISNAIPVADLLK